jgi:hypothetical protein
MSLYDLYPDIKLDPIRVRAFVYASASAQIKAEEKSRKDAEHRAKRKK